MNKTNLDSKGAALEISKVRFKYPGATSWVIDLPELRVERGETVFVYGPSGSGKSTFLELVAGVLIPNEGVIQVDGQLISEMTSSERDRFRADHLGYIFQSFNLIPYLTAQENILLALALSPSRKANVQDKANEAAQTLARELGIEQLLDRKVHQMSVGQQQRVAAARALIGSPGLILADEPTSALDADHREKFIQSLFLAASKRGSTILFVSHDRALEPLFHRSLRIGSS